MTTLETPVDDIFTAALKDHLSKHEYFAKKVISVEKIGQDTDYSTEWIVKTFHERREGKTPILGFNHHLVYNDGTTGKEEVTQIELLSASIHKKFYEEKGERKFTLMYLFSLLEGMNTPPIVPDFEIILRPEYRNQPNFFDCKAPIWGYAFFNTDTDKIDCFNIFPRDQLYNDFKQIMTELAERKK